MPRRRLSLYRLIAILACLPPASQAHEDLDRQIAALSERIRKSPGEATLYLRRGELHRIHRDWRNSLADYRRARALDPDLVIIDFCRGRALIEAGRDREGLHALTAFLDREPSHRRARVLLARALARLGSPLEAAETIAEAIETSEGTEPPRPQDYLERARWFAAAGDSYLEEALCGLDVGLRRLGRPVTLELLAIELELRRGEVDAALERLERLAEASARRERWLVWRTEILVHAERLPEAREAAEAAASAIDSLSPRHRQTRATAALEEVLLALLARMDDRELARK